MIKESLDNLTDKQRAFIEAYTSPEGNRNTTRSAVLAGYAGRNAGRIGARLLHNTQIRAIIDGRLNLTYDAWKKEGIDAYRSLDLKSPVRVRYWELVGKSSGWLKDNEVTINHLSVNADDILRLRKSLIGNEIGQQAIQAIDNQADQAVVSGTTNGSDGVVDSTTGSIEGGGVEEAVEPPATPCDSYNDANQTTHKI